MLEALQQRLEKYKSAAAQAKASGDDRKGRMHERIAKVKPRCSKLLASSRAIRIRSLAEDFSKAEIICVLSFSLKRAPGGKL